MKNGKCGICLHLDRVRIELEVAGGASIRAIARKYSVTYQSLGRHWKNHVSDERKANLVLGPVQRQALAARVAEENSSVIDNMKIIRAGLFEAYSAALEAKDRYSTALIASRLHENLRIVANITGELANSPLVMNNTTNIFVNDPQFAAFQARLIKVLSRFSDARDAVVAEFESLEVSAAQPALEHKGARQCLTA